MKRIQMFGRGNDVNNSRAASEAGADELERPAEYCSCLDDTEDDVLQDAAGVTWGEFEAPRISGCAMLDIER